MEQSTVSKRWQVTHLDQNGVKTESQNLANLKLILLSMIRNCLNRIKNIYICIFLPALLKGKISRPISRAKFIQANLKRSPFPRLIFIARTGGEN